MKNRVKWRQSLIVVSATVALMFVVLAVSKGDPPKSVTPVEAKALLQSDSSMVILDVRTEGEYKSETGHLGNAILIPVQEIEKRIGELAPFKERTILVYCRTGHRSTIAAGILQEHGFDVRNMDGGITQWLKENFPVVK